MDEVDNIIVHSLRQIGCKFEDDFIMQNFTPELLVHAVATCILEIKPNAANCPTSLPQAMAQRFTVATALAEMCAGCGYRSDIGYQTFLYPNAVDLRRLFMFLIEQLPSRTVSEPATSQGPIGEYEMLRKEIKEKMLKQLRAPWVPQYGRAVGNRKYDGCSSQIVKFAPQLNLNIPGPESSTRTKEVQHYLQQQAPNVFQQTAAEEYDLVSSVLHKNDIDLHTTGEQSTEPIKYSLGVTASNKKLSKDVTSATTPGHPAPNNEVLPNIASVVSLTPLEKLNESVNALKCQNDELLAETKTTSIKINSIKNQQAAMHANMDQLRKEAKIHERTCVVLENPKENVTKLEGLIQSSQERKKTLHQQWQEYRQPMIDNLDTLKNEKQAKNIQNVMDLRAVIAQLEQSLREKTAGHAKLAAELKAVTNNAAPRNEYTRRIMEFIGNIRKQRNDIYKVLDDTRDLQKQLNSVMAQLQRQFNYTDDLLFQSAKHDLHAKKAYKLLASLHATCNELVELVSQTGNITKDIRDLEVQIDREKMKNIAASLEQISADIHNFENVIKSIQSEIRKVENEITAG